MNTADRLKNLTAKELQDLFFFMDEKDMQLIVNALRALAGDTESLQKLQRLHVSIEQGILKLLKLAEGFEAPLTEYNPESRYFRPVNGFTNDKKFIEVRVVESLDNGGKELETLIHFNNGKVLIDDKELYKFEYINDSLHSGLWEELHHTVLNDLKGE